MLISSVHTHTQQSACSVRKALQGPCVLEDTQSTQSRSQESCLSKLSQWLVIKGYLHSIRQRPTEKNMWMKSVECFVLVTVNSCLCNFHSSVSLCLCVKDRKRQRFPLTHCYMLVSAVHDP